MGDEIKTLLTTIVAQNKQIQEDIAGIKAELSRQSECSEKVNENIVALKRENEALRSKLFSVEKKLKRNNIIIFGVKEEIVDYQNYVRELINTSLKVPVGEAEINNIYLIGNKSGSKTRPLILELVSSFKKLEILKNASKLKGSRIIFANDLTPKERAEQKLLHSQMKIARGKQREVKIVKNTLVVSGKTYTCKQLEEYGIGNIIDEDILCNTETNSSNSGIRTRLPSSSKPLPPNNPELKKTTSADNNKQLERDLRSGPKKIKP